MSEMDQMAHLSAQVNQILANQERHEKAYGRIIEMLSRIVSLEERQINHSAAMDRFGKRLDCCELRIRDMERNIDRRSIIQVWIERGLMIGLGMFVAKTLGLTTGF